MGSFWGQAASYAVSLWSASSTGSQSKSWDHRLAGCERVKGKEVGIQCLLTLAVIGEAHQSLNFKMQLGLFWNSFHWHFFSEQLCIPVCLHLCYNKNYCSQKTLSHYFQVSVKQYLSKTPLSFLQRRSTQLFTHTLQETRMK